MLIHVRRRHIVEGMRGRVSSCPIALAYKEAQGGCVLVHRTWIITGAGDFDLPDAAQQFINDFDAGLPVKPFAFVLK